MREKNKEKNKYRIQVSLLILFGVTASADHHGDGPAEPCHMYYPNIPGEMLLDNDKLVVQRFIIEPGQWEGYAPPPASATDSAVGRLSVELTEKHLPHASR